MIVSLSIILFFSLVIHPLLFLFFLIPSISVCLLDLFGIHYTLLSVTFFLLKLFVIPLCAFLIGAIVERQSLENRELPCSLGLLSALFCISLVTPELVEVVDALVATQRLSSDFHISTVLNLLGTAFFSAGLVSVAIIGFSTALEFSLAWVSSALKPEMPIAFETMRLPLAILICALFFQAISHVVSRLLVF